MPSPSLEVHVGKRIAVRRVMLGLSTEALARRTGLPLMRVQAYEAGRRRVVAPDLVRLCDALTVGPAYFLDGLPSPENEESEAGDEDGPVWERRPVPSNSR